MISGIAIADVSSDGIPDIILANEASDDPHVAVFGNGDGTFESSFEFAVAPEARSVAVADLNADGFRDVVVATDDSVSVLLSFGTLFAS